MTVYAGPLAALIDISNLDITDTEAIPQCSEVHGHAFAMVRAVMGICSGRTVTLTRRKMTPSFGERPGSITGFVRGMSSRPEGMVLLGLELEDGTGVGVDVTDPQAWAWEVHP